MMDLTWFIVGLLTSLVAVVIYDVNKQYELKIVDWFFLLLGSVLILFSIPWAVASVLEGVSQAASMGILLFGLPGIVLLSIEGRRLKRVSVKTSNSKRSTNVTEVQKTIQSLQVKNTGIRPRPWPKPVAVIAYILLVLAVCFGGLFNNQDYVQRLHNDFPEAEIKVISDSPPTFELNYADGTVKYAAMGKGQGYGGPMILGVLADAKGKIEKIKLLANQETPAYRQQIGDADFPSQFEGKVISDDFIVGKDVDAVTGATVSCVAGTNAIRSAAHHIAVNSFDIQPTWQDESFHIEIEEFIIFILIVCSFLSLVQKNKWLRYTYLAFVIYIIGFYTNASLSVGSFAGLFMGYFPAIKTNLIWWLLICTTVGAVIILGKNMWCNKLCPFFAVQFLLNKISGSRIKQPDWVIIHGGKLLGMLVWLSLMVVFLSRNPALGSYEPFSMMFSLTGVGIQWFLLPASIVGAFFMPLFWCRSFCPLGHFIKESIRFRKIVFQRFNFAKERAHEE